MEHRPKLHPMLVHCKLLASEYIRQMRKQRVNARLCSCVLLDCTKVVNLYLLSSLTLSGCFIPMLILLAMSCVLCVNNRHKT